MTLFQDSHLVLTLLGVAITAAGWLLCVRGIQTKAKNQKPMPVRTASRVRKNPPRFRR